MLAKSPPEWETIRTGPDPLVAGRDWVLIAGEVPAGAELSEIGATREEAVSPTAAELISVPFVACPSYVCNSVSEITPSAHAQEVIDHSAASSDNAKLSESPFDRRFRRTGFGNAAGAVSRSATAC